MKLETQTGYNFTVSWRKLVDGVSKSALGLFNFKVAPMRILSYQAELLEITNSSGIVNVHPAGSLSGIIFLEFSLVLLGAASEDVELLTEMQYNNRLKQG